MVSSQQKWIKEGIHRKEHTFEINQLIPGLGLPQYHINKVPIVYVCYVNMNIT